MRDKLISIALFILFLIAGGWLFIILPLEIRIDGSPPILYVWQVVAGIVVAAFIGAIHFGRWFLADLRVRRHFNAIPRLCKMTGTGNDQRILTPRVSTIAKESRGKAYRVKGWPGQDQEDLRTGVEQAFQTAYPRHAVVRAERDETDRRFVIVYVGNDVTAEERCVGS